MKIEHIDNLSKWKKSWANIWSRKTSHRLRNYERVKYELALKNKYLEVDNKDRNNLINLWDKVCEAKKYKKLILHKLWEKWVIKQDNKTIFSWYLKEAKKIIKTLVN